MKNDVYFDEVPLKPGMGSIIATGVLKGIKGSKLTPTEIFLRETVQNSYDAVKTDGQGKKGQLKYTIRGFHSTNEQYKDLVSIMSAKHSNSFFEQYVASNIYPGMFNVEVSDTNTTGLIGEIEPSERVGNQNFTNFVYFTGNDKKKDTTSGGSYGFGKASLYAYSKARTIIVYTRIEKSNSAIILNHHDYRFESRLIAIAIDDRIQDTASDRCWWGKITEYTDKTRGVYAAPITGQLADEIALAVGFSSFKDSETGTKLLVLNAGPKEMPRDIADNPISEEELFRNYIPKYLVHWYWNHIYFNNIIFSVEYENEIMHIDNPHDVFPYRKFIDALEIIEKNRHGRAIIKTKNYSMISYEKPSVTLGFVGIAKAPPLRIKYSNLFSVFSSSDPVVAYMRGIGHVVYYESVPMHTSSIQTTCYGVFWVHNSAAPIGENPGAIDRYFRQIENQTHDRWVHDSGVSRFNYLNAVTNAVHDIVQLNTATTEEEVRATNISVIIQRTLGSKLMRYDKNIGGATSSRDNSPTSNTGPNIVKDSIYYQGTSNIEATEDGKIVTVQYKASVKDGTKIRINSITPKVITIDNDTIEDESSVKFFLLSYSGRGKNPMISKFKSFPIEIPYSLVFYVSVLCMHECTFDLSIGWEEVNE